MSKKIALVTGAGKGIGAAIATTLARDGCAVVVSDQHADGGGAAVAQQIRDEGGDASFVVADVGKEASVEALVAETVEQFGRLDIAVNSAYVTAKHAVAGLIKSAALDYARHGMRINAVAARTVMTDMTRARMGEHYTEDQVAALRPIGRTGTAQEIADAVAWLASGAASFCVGAMVAVDGGLTV